MMLGAMIPSTIAACRSALDKLKSSKVWGYALTDESYQKYRSRAETHDCIDGLNRVQVVSAPDAQSPSINSLGLHRDVCNNDVGGPMKMLYLVAGIVIMMPMLHTAVSYCYVSCSKTSACHLQLLTITTLHYHIPWICWHHTCQAHTGMADTL